MPAPPSPKPQVKYEATQEAKAHARAEKSRMGTAEIECWCRVAIIWKAARSNIRRRKRTRSKTGFAVGENDMTRHYGIPPRQPYNDGGVPQGPSIIGAMAGGLLLAWAIAALWAVVWIVGW